MAKPLQQYEPGQRVRVTQQIPQRDEVWAHRVEGTVVRFEQRKTGSWYAHARDDKLWLDRLVLRKDDGEIVVCSLDRYSHLEVLPEPEAEEPSAAEGEAEEGGETQEPAAEK